MFVFTVIAVNLALFLRACVNAPGNAMRETGRTIEKAGKALADLASAFNQGTIRTEFFSYATTISNQQYFQFATLKQMEVFTRTEEMTTGFGYVPLPEVVVEAKAPVECTYFVDLNGNWNFVFSNNVLYAFTPPIRFNRPAVDASKITYEVRKGHFKTAAAQENLKNSITSLSVLRAKENIPLVKENGRRQITEFVERWLAKSFTDGTNHPVRVYFPGEKPPDHIIPPPLN